MKKKLVHPLLSWDIISDNRSQSVQEKCQKSLQKLKQKFDWNLSITSLLKAKFDAIVVTDRDENIVWASEGFEQMTGYKVSHAKNKKPAFLQGVNTDPETKKRIRSAIQRRQPIAETLINYRKNGSEYHCRVEITPLYNSENILTHFIALESEVQ